MRKKKIYPQHTPKECAKGNVKGLFVMGEDILISEPNAERVEEAVENCEFLVCQEILPNMTTAFADVVLNPALPADIFRPDDPAAAGSAQAEGG